MRNGILLSTFLLTACGGGTSPAVNFEPLVSPTPPTTTAFDLVAKGKVIDGYVEGATVTIDINANGVVDDFEPQVISGTDGEFVFTRDDLLSFYGVSSDDFASWITTNFGITSMPERTLKECLMVSPKIADVPVGAYDTSRGYVETAYRLLLLPYNTTWEEAQWITPFSSLYQRFISDVGSTLTPQEGCSSEGESIRLQLQDKVNQFNNDFFNGTGISLQDFNIDYIESEDAYAIAIGERLVDIITDVYTIESVYKDTDYNDFWYRIDNYDLDRLFNLAVNGETVDSVFLNLMFRTNTTESADGWYDSSYKHTYGELDIVNDTIEDTPLSEIDSLVTTNTESINYEIIENTRVDLINSITWQFVTEEEYSMNDTQCQNYVRKDMKDDGNVSIMVSPNCDMNYYTTYFRNSWNTETGFSKYDVTYQWDEVSTLNAGIENFENDIAPYLYSDDFVVVRKDVGTSTYEYSYSSTQEYCKSYTNGSLTETTYGYDGFLQCKQLME